MVRSMTVADHMTRLLVAVGPGHTLAEAAAMMAERNVGSAVVVDPGRPGASIFTERDLLRAVAAGVSETEPVGGHLTDQASAVSLDTDLQDAARLMLEGGFRHLVVVDQQGEPCGMLSMRDIVSSWVTNNTFEGRDGPGQR